MISFTTAIGFVVHLTFNVSINYATAYLGSQSMRESQDSFSGDMALIVAVDTAFRFMIANILFALKIPYDSQGTAGHLLTICLTPVTLHLSMGLAKRIRHRTELENRRFDFIRVFGYTCLAWMANLMIRDVMCITLPSPKPA